jgi:hypothetical protein
MPRPVYVWRLDELENGKTLHYGDDGMELKVAGDDYRVWLVDGIKVQVEELVEKVVDGALKRVWQVAEVYPALEQATKLLSAPM